MGDSYHAVGNRENYMFPTGKLIVTVVKARGIRGDEAFGFGMADPYGMIRVGGRNHALTTNTSVRKDAGKFPEWKEVFSFPITKVHEEYNHLRIDLYNKNSWPRKDNFIGYIWFNDMSYYLRQNGYSVEEKWYTVRDRHYNIRGEIYLGFNFIPIAAAKLHSGSCEVMGGVKTDENSDRNTTQWLELGFAATQAALAVASFV